MRVYGFGVLGCRGWGFRFPFLHRYKEHAMRKTLVCMSQILGMYRSRV